MNQLMTRVELLRAACCVAGADGEAGAVERLVLERLARDAGLNEATMEELIKRAESDTEFYATQFRKVTTDPYATMEFLFAVALADCELKTSELGVLYKMAHRLGVSDEEFAKLRAFAIDQVKWRRAC